MCQKMVDKLEFYVSKGFSWKLPCIFVFKTDSQYMYLRKRTVISFKASTGNELSWQTLKKKVFGKVNRHAS